MSKAATAQKAQRGGIMQSIAKATTKSTAAPARKATTPVAQSPANSAVRTSAVSPVRTAAFDWSTMPAPEVVVYHKAVAKTDVEGTTPEQIKAWVRDGFEKTAVKGSPVYTAVVFPSPEMAAEAVKLAKRYATFKGYTLRGGVDKAEPVRVSIAVKPKETRTRKAAA